MNIELNFRSDPNRERSDKAPAPNVLLIGNFSGQRTQPGSEQEPASILTMSSAEPGELDESVASIAPVFRLGDGSLEIPVRSMGDFHPDRLLANLPMYAEITALKKALADPATAAQAVAMCRKLLGIAPPAEAPAQDQLPPTSAAESADEKDDTFERLLGRPATQPDATDPRVKGALQRIMGQLGSEGMTPGAAPETGQLRQQLDEFLAAALRELLYDPAFRTLEATWRSAEWLLQNLEAEEEPVLWLIDVGAARPESWSPAVTDRVSRSLDSVASIVLLEAFSDTPASLSGLGAVSQMGAHLSSTVYAGADSSLAGIEQLPGEGLTLDAKDVSTDMTDSWQTARAAAGSSQIVLGFPRVLLRQPYGSRTDPIDRMEFEELLPAPDHEAFLWGGPGPLLAAITLRQSNRLDGLPVVTYDDGGGQAIKPPCESYIADSAAERILDRGIVPLIAHRGQTAVQVLRIETIAS